MSVAVEHMSTRPDLRQLLDGYATAPALPIRGICSDSRHANAGDVFLAVQGDSSHGLDYLDKVISVGVAAIAWDADTGNSDGSDAGIPMIPVAGLASKLGSIANRWFDSPSSKIKVAGVTGTNGKTTVAWLIVRCMQRLGNSSAYIGTLGAGVNELQFSGGMTTPACIELQGLLAGFEQAGANSAALEVSSHGIEQRRVDGVHFDAALFTNLSRDHIDYHGDMESYFATKKRLFQQSDLAHRIICIDSDHGKELAHSCRANVVTVSSTADVRIADWPFVNIRDVNASAHGSRVSVSTSWGDARFELPMPGDFNVTNALLVLALMLRWEISLADACRVLGEVTAPPGRMQCVEHTMRPAVFVDYAHTPAGLEAVLKALRPHCRANLWCVFGCGGERDRGKRPQMGAAAAKYADHAVVTNDNPRSEKPGEIFADILKGMPADTTVIESRAAAIAYAISKATNDDLVLIAGKGHEDYQVIGDKRLPFSDCTSALANLAARQAGDSARQ